MRVTIMSAGLALVLSGCVVASPHGPPPVPAARYEPVPPPPGPRLVWQPGGWHWNGAGYVWIRGHYVQHLAAYHQWVPGHWAPGGGWVPAHWV
jgi:hypothetical protein